MNSYSPVGKRVRSLFYNLGLDVKRLKPQSNPCLQLIKALDSFGINLVFDIGANEGQFVSDLRVLGYQGEIVSFEPLSDAHFAISAAARKDPKWTVHPRSAIGDNNGEIEINISKNSVSSSIAPILNSHLAASSASAYVGSEKVLIHTLDSVAQQYTDSDNTLFVKIDTQGFEWQVIDGAVETLERAKGVLCELSIIPLYEGQHLWLDVLNRLESYGFKIWSIEQAFVDPKNGQTLQINVCLFK